MCIYIIHQTSFVQKWSILVRNETLSQLIYQSFVMLGSVWSFSHCLFLRTYASSTDESAVTAFVLTIITIKLSSYSYDSIFARKSSRNY